MDTTPVSNVPDARTGICTRNFIKGKQTGIFLARHSSGLARRRGGFCEGNCYNRASRLNTGFRIVDLAVILVYLAGVTWFGARFKNRQHSLKDYFLGGREAPWWAIALSIVSAETSTLTIIGTPPLAYGGSFVFLQVVFGYLLARIVISVLFLNLTERRRA